MNKTKKLVDSAGNIAVKLGKEIFILKNQLAEKDKEIAELKVEIRFLDKEAYQYLIEDDKFIDKMSEKIDVKLQAENADLKSQILRYLKLLKGKDEEIAELEKKLNEKDTYEILRDGTIIKLKADLARRREVDKKIIEDIIVKKTTGVSLVGGLKKVEFATKCAHEIAEKLALNKGEVK